MPVDYTERSLLKYTQQVIDLFRNPKNVGEMEDATVTAVEGDPKCGDMFKMFLKIDNGKITDAKFLSFGCAANIATGSMTTEMVKGLSVDEAEKISIKDISNRLGGLPALKMHCAVLAYKTLRKAIQSYRELEAKKQGKQGP
ncbi:MAG: iron-sulfur cluster assembly scaffold protein [Hadesarchaea archaeon YNP_N21]|jgi:NifU-like protein involved in Fe-S cluster formation|nr:MAG: iron-sulfur cluster assembly scaffold protein [Hadesarchaea archaeon YNP_N21]